MNLFLGILEFPTMSSPSPFGGSLYGILEFPSFLLKYKIQKGK